MRLATLNLEDCNSICETGQSARVVERSRCSTTCQRRNEDQKQMSASCMFDGRIHGFVAQELTA